MKTKPIPAIVMLVAGLVVCIAGMAGHMETGRFVKMLLVVPDCVLYHWRNCKTVD